MNDQLPTYDFLAVLVYENGPNRRCEEPRIYSAVHPEIAYQKALADGGEQRYGQQFVGLSHLEETADGGPLISRTQGGAAAELVVDKDQLAAFSDPRWAGVECDQAILNAALREPDLLFEVDGLEEIPWHTYSHAYGIAIDIPRDLRRLASSDAMIREKALWELGGSIYHQGTIYSATAVAVPFLIQLITDQRLPARAEICNFLVEIAESSAIHPDQIRKNWNWRREHLGENWPKSSDQMAEDEIADVTAVRHAFLENIEAIRKCCSDEDPEVRKHGSLILQQVEAPSQAPISSPCPYCHGSGECKCKHQGAADSEKCVHCKGTGKCRICRGSGARR
jgi:hypothetical protein